MTLSPLRLYSFFAEYEVGVYLPMRILTTFGIGKGCHTFNDAIVEAGFQLIGVAFYFRNKVG
jgi:hypothetical protein